MQHHYDTLETRLLYPTTASEMSARYSVDFIVNGTSLHELLRADPLAGRFCQAWFAKSLPETAEVFLLKRVPDLENGRVMLYICNGCGDISCGAITLQVSNTEDGGYVWSDFAFENDYDEEMTDRASHAAIGPFRFSAEQYQAAIEHAASLVEG